MDTYDINKGEGPLIASAIHDGHRVREELQPYLKLDSSQRLREEDPFTARWVNVVPTNIIVLQSRFEVDVNRPRDKAVYQEPEDAWGLQVWGKPLPPTLIRTSLQQYDAFYSAVKALFDEKIAKYGYFILFDLHTYNHRREGPEGEKASREANPEVNIGTKHMDREKWDPVVEAFMQRLRSFDYGGRSLDVRENIKFKGGYFVNWVHETYQDSCCAMAVEFKKFFMDEWTGELDQLQHEMLGNALRSTLQAVSDAASALNT